MSNTPETDSDNDLQCELAAWELLAEARRERDEAREAFIIATDQMVQAQCKLRESNKERDEAREKMADALQEVDLRTLDFERMKQERDIAEDERIDMAQQLESEKDCHASCQNERDEARDIGEKLSKQGLDMMDKNRSLSRELDKAREENAKLRDIAKRAINIPQIIELADGTKCVRLEDFLRERDKERTELEKVEHERDEAKAALMRIEDLFLDGTDIYADRENMGMIARNALESALKRGTK